MDKEFVLGLSKKASELKTTITNACRDAIDEIINLFEGLDTDRIDVEDWWDDNCLECTEVHHVINDGGTICVYPDIGEDVEYTSEDWFYEAPALLEILTMAVLSKIDFTSKVKVGAKVKWNDPAINDYPEEERAKALNRIFTIFKVEGDTEEDCTVWISDGVTEAEVNYWELEFVL